jgi:cytosine/uracil/thiamine/allantoin permease
MGDAAAAIPEGYSDALYNEDMAPTPEDHRTWNLWHIASLWVGMSVCIPTYMLAGSLIQQGLSWVEAVMLIFVGNLVVLVPMIVNGHAGTKHGIPFPVLLRTSFGHHGAHIPAVLRALVACGWFGIQTWIGGNALHLLTNKFLGDAIWPNNPAMWPNSDMVDGYQLFMYVLFWLMNVYFVWKGTESIKWLETYAAPFLLGIGLLLLGWGVNEGGGLTAVLARSNDLARPVMVASTSKDILAEAGRAVDLQLSVLTGGDGKPKAASMILGEVVPPQGGKPEELRPLTGWIPYEGSYRIDTTQGEVWARFDNEAEDTDERSSSVVRASVDAKAGQSTPRWLIYLTGITAMVAFWATLALNIPDITRFAASQKDQALGQLIGLPLTMGLYSFIGLAVTCATLNIFPDLVIGADAIWDPVVLLARFESKAAVIVAMVMLAVATLTTNIAANVISPANCFSNAWPSRIDFRTGGMMAAVIGLLMFPWKLLNTYIGWLVTYSGLLGPIMGVMIVDYLLIRRSEIDHDALYIMQSSYHYAGGFHVAGVVATLVGIGVVATGMVVPSLGFLAQGAWFTGAIAAGVVYMVMAKRPAKS